MFFGFSFVQYDFVTALLQFIPIVSTVSSCSFSSDRDEVGVQSALFDHLVDRCVSFDDSLYSRSSEVSAYYSGNA